MNELTLIRKPPYNIGRIIAKVCIVMARMALLPQGVRLKLLKMGGVRIHGRCFIGANVSFDGISPDLISIGEGCVITTGTHILSHFYNTKERRFYQGRVNIGENVFIGMHTLIVNAVNIGNNAVIGAGSIVNRDVPPNEIWGGNPARFIKKVE